MGIESKDTILPSSYWKWIVVRHEDNLTWLAFQDIDCAFHSAHDHEGAPDRRLDFSESHRSAATKKSWRSEDTLLSLLAMDPRKGTPDT